MKNKLLVLIFPMLFASFSYASVCPLPITIHFDTSSNEWVGPNGWVSYAGSTKDHSHPCGAFSGALWNINVKNGGGWIQCNYYGFSGPINMVNQNFSSVPTPTEGAWVTQIKNGYATCHSLAALCPFGS